MRASQCTLFSILIASSTAYAGSKFNLTLGVTPGSEDIYNLHMTVFWVCVVIGTLVFGTLFYSIIFHRKSRGVKPAHFHEHLIVELLWTVIPFLILVGLAIPGTRVLLSLNDVKKSDLTIKVTGYQWKWKYEYIDYGVSFFSNLSTSYDERLGKKPKNPYYLQEVDNPLVIPTHKKIRFLITSNDVIHSWYVPAFGVKRDGVPGFINEIWARVNRPGIYRGQCAQLCGINHGFMPIIVEAKNEKDFNDWLIQKGGKGMPGMDASHAAMGPNPAEAASTSAVPAGTTSSTAPSATPAGTTPSAAPSAAPAGTAPSTAPSATPAGTAPSTAPSATPAGTAPSTAPSATPAGTTPSAAPSAAPAGTAPSAAPSAAPAGTTPSSATSALPVTGGSPKVAMPSTTPPNKLSKEDLMKKGEHIYQTICVACHQPNGEGMPPLYPMLKGSRIVNGPIKTHIHIVLNGKPGTAMQAFRDQISDEEIAAIITYERNSWGNNTGDIVQPEQIKTEKEQGPKP